MILIKSLFFKNIYKYFNNKKKLIKKNYKILAYCIKNYYYSTFGKNITPLSTNTYNFLAFFIQNLKINNTNTTVYKKTFI